MTIVVYDGECLAVDSQMNIGDGIVSNHVNKIFADSKWVIAGCGHWHEILKGVKTVQQCESLKALENLQLKRIQIPDIELIALYRPEGIVFNIYENMTYDVVTGKIAIGSGWQWAVAAMDFGNDAIEAAKYACERSRSCGGLIESMRKHEWTIPNT